MLVKTTAGRLLWMAEINQLWEPEDRFNSNNGLLYTHNKYNKNVYDLFEYRAIIQHRVIWTYNSFLNNNKHSQWTF